MTKEKEREDKEKRQRNQSLKGRVEKEEKI